MASGIKKLRKLQIGTETVAGTPVAATASFTDLNFPFLSLSSAFASG